MGGRKTTNHEFQTALQGKKIPLVILDQKWHGLFSDDGKPKSIVKLEKKANEYLKKQARLNQDIKDLKNLKEKLMKNIMANMEETEEEQESVRLREDRRLISEINVKLRQAYADLEELPKELDAVNETLMVESMEYCYEKMRANEIESEAIRKWLEKTREEVKQRAARRQTVQDKNREIYSYMHDIFGADIIDIFDLTYEKEPTQKEEEERQS